MKNTNDLSIEEREALLQEKAQKMIEEIDHYIKLAKAKLKEVEEKKSQK